MRSGDGLKITSLMDWMLSLILTLLVGRYIVSSIRQQRLTDRRESGSASHSRRVAIVSNNDDVEWKTSMNSNK